MHPLSKHWREMNVICCGLNRVRRHNRYLLCVLCSVGPPQVRPILGAGAGAGPPSRIIRSYQAEDELTSHFQLMDIAKGNSAVPPPNTPLPACTSKWRECSRELSFSHWHHNRQFLCYSWIACFFILCTTNFIDLFIFLFY